uniref:Bcl-2 Bcl-2 homology region 1-3 domain-containing protein n=1 Tax=Timema shepardi TaxID=629360 RepID=A0A7R9AKM4_TIMSH|nr:unnamed protein product [Timema shepardi]
MKNGVTSERVVALFFFCSDLALRALRDNWRDLFHRLVQWTQVYIMSTLSVWVQKHGGWEVALRVSHSSLMSSDRMKPGLGDRAGAVLGSSVNHVYKLAMDKYDISSHLDEFTDAVDNIQDMGIEIVSDPLNIMMLYSLSHAYTNFRIAIRQTGYN